LTTLKEYVYETDSGKTCSVQLYPHEVKYMKNKPSVNNLRIDESKPIPKTLAQGGNELIKIIKDAYAKGDKDTVINRVKISFECFLQSGLNVGTISRTLLDFGVREEELAIGLVQGILKVPDEKLREEDKPIKQEAIQVQGKMLLAVLENAVKENTKK